MAKTSTKKKPSAERPPLANHPITFKLTDDELAQVEAHRKALPGVTPRMSAYAKHAVLGYPALARLHEVLTKSANNSEDDYTMDARRFLTEAGL